MGDEIEDVKFIEVYEKIPAPPTAAESVMQKIEEYNKEQDSEENESK
jgi:hypothetical protein